MNKKKREARRKRRAAISESLWKACVEMCLRTATRLGDSRFVLMVGTHNLAAKNSEATTVLHDMDNCLWTVSTPIDAIGWFTLESNVKPKYGVSNQFSMAMQTAMEHGSEGSILQAIELTVGKHAPAISPERIKERLRRHAKETSSLLFEDPNLLRP